MFSYILSEFEKMQCIKIYNLFYMLAIPIPFALKSFIFNYSRMEW